MRKLVRITTVPMSLQILLKGQLSHMSQYFEVVAISSDEPTLAKVEKEEGVRTIAVNMTRVISPLKDIAALYKLIRILKHERPFIVHTHTPKAGLLGMIAAYVVKVPVRLHTVAGLPLMEASGLKRIVLEIIEKITYRCATKVFPNSKNLSSFILQNKFCNPGKLKLIGNGSSNAIDTNHFQPSLEIDAEAKLLSASLNFKATDFVFVFVGRLVTDKGLNELLQAYQSLHKQHPFIKLLLIGPFEHSLDPLNKASLQIIKDNDSIVSCGFINDIRPYLAVSNVLVLPSYREGFPNAPMQAGCFHLPCIVTNINGCNEIIEDEVNGLLIPVKNIAALEDAMNRLIVDRKLYRKLQTNARRMIVDRYDQNHFWELLLQQYEQDQTEVQQVHTAKAMNG